MVSGQDTDPENRKLTREKAGGQDLGEWQESRRVAAHAAHSCLYREAAAGDKGGWCYPWDLRKVTHTLARPAR